MAPLGLKNPVLVGAMKPQASQPVSQSMWTLQQGVECPSDLSSDSSERVTTLRGILLGRWRRSAFLLHIIEINSTQLNC